MKLKDFFLNIFTVTKIVKVIPTIFLQLKVATSIILIYSSISFAQETFKDGIGLIQAVQTTLTNHPTILIQTHEVEKQKGNWQFTKGEFDATLKTSISHSHEEATLSSEEGMSIAKEQESDTLLTKVDISKKFRSGMTIVPSVQLNRTDKSIHPGNAVLSFPPVNEARIDFTILMPLMKGRGAKAAAANEMYAQKGYEISIDKLRHTISEQIFNAAAAYWSYLAANKALMQIKRSEARAKAFVKETKTFIIAGNRPESDLDQTIANLADKNIARISGEQNLLEQRQNLGIAMWLSLDKIRSLPKPSDTFLRIEYNEISDLMAKADELIKLSLKKRKDYLVSKKQQNQQKIMIEKAKNNLRAQLDLQFNIGYSGLYERTNYLTYFAPITENIPGTNIGISLNCTLPFKNNSAKGLLLQQKSDYMQRLISAKDLAKNISSNVITAISKLKNSCKELSKAQESVDSYLSSVKNEKKKVQLGTSTLIDLIQIEDRLTNALLKKISIQQKLCVALLRLRFETGTILSEKQKTISIGIKELTTIPLSDIGSKKPHDIKQDQPPVETEKSIVPFLNNYDSLHFGFILKFL